MSFPAFSTRQALSIWSDLWMSFYEGGAFSLYAYRLLEHSPTDDPNDLVRGKEAADGLSMLLDLFLTNGDGDERDDVRITVDGTRWHRGDRLRPELWRWEVDVQLVGKKS